MKKYLLFYALLAASSVSLQGMETVRPFQKKDTKELALFIMKNIDTFLWEKRKSIETKEHVKSLLKYLTQDILLMATRTSLDSTECITGLVAISREQKKYPVSKDIPEFSIDAPTLEIIASDKDLEVKLRYEILTLLFQEGKYKAVEERCKIKLNKQFHEHIDTHKIIKDTFQEKDFNLRGKAYLFSHYYKK